MQEFFAAKHLVNTKKKKEIKRFVCNQINDGKWKVVIQFVAGLLNSSSDIFIKLLPELPKQRTLSWPATRKDKDLAVQVCKCLYLIKDELQPVLQNKMGKIKLNKVDFNLCSLAPTDVAAVLHFLENAAEVFFIDLSNNELGDLGSNEMTKFIVHRKGKLKGLDLSRNNFTDKSAIDLAAALNYSKCELEMLFLCNNNFNDNAAKYFAAALKHSNCKLESLDLRGNKFTKKGHQYLIDAEKESNCRVYF